MYVAISESTGKLTLMQVSYVCATTDETNSNDLRDIWRVKEEKYWGDAKVTAKPSRVIYFTRE